MSPVIRYMEQSMRRALPVVFIKEENFHVLSKSRWRSIKLPYITYVIKILDQGT